MAVTYKPKHGTGSLHVLVQEIKRWIFPFSGMWRCVVGWVLPDVSKARDVFIFKGLIYIGVEASAVTRRCYGQRM